MEPPEMTKRRFAKRWAFVSVMVMAFAAPAASAQSVQQVEPAPAKAGRLINTGDILTGELNAMRVKGGKRGPKTATYQITSEARRLPPPSGLCNLETGPETFQLVISSDAQAAQLKGRVGKEISVKVDEVACAEAAGQMSEAVVTKWSVVTKP
jgi:opacity protein-like surface antigen